ncbi:MAG: alpha/beta hydrolase [Thermoleophilia bacterium]
MTTERVKAGEIRLSVTTEGDGEPVILLHGFPELAYSWRHQIPALAAGGYRAIAPDLRGYGASDRPSLVEDYGIQALAGDVANLMDAMGIDRAHVVGHDWGGSLAWVTAAVRPERVRSLVILNSPHPVASAEARNEDPAQRAKSWYMLLFQFPGVAETWLSKDDFHELREMVFRNAAPGTFTPEDEAVFTDAFRQDGALTAALNYYRANMPAAAWLRPPPQLPPVTVPTMIVWGEGDAYLGLGLLDRSAAKVAGPLRVERLPGVSHWVQQEAPDRVNALLLDWFGNVPAA